MCANKRCGKKFDLIIPDYHFGLQVDHCHKTNKIRGLLCLPCNVSLGYLEEDTERLLGLVDYLNGFK